MGAVSKGVADFAKGVVSEAGKQVVSAAEEVIDQTLSSVAPSSIAGQSQANLSSTANDSSEAEIAKLREQLGRFGDSQPVKKGRNLEAEMGQVSKEKKELEAREARLLAQMEDQRRLEEEAAKADTADVLATTGHKKARGSAFATQTKGTSESGRGKKQ